MTQKQLRQSLLAVILTLLIIGIVAVYSSSSMASEATYGDSLRFFVHHLISIACGLFLGLACLMVPYAGLRRFARWMFVCSLIALALVFLFGQEVGGARRWFHIGRLSIQPSEFAQLSLVIYLADLLARHQAFIHEFRRGLLPPLCAVGLASGMVLIQPDLGTAIAMGSVALFLLVVAKARWGHLALVVALAAFVLVFLIAGAEYRRRRILAFLNPWQDSQGVGYQILQSYCALASGGLIGAGVGGSIQRLFYLPSAHTDFIFAIIGEEMGLLGSTAIIVLFCILLICGFKIAMAIEDLFGRYLACGIVGMLGLEAIVNIAVVTGLLPTKGLPLPFISYGGTSMIVNLVSCALLFRASLHGERVALESALDH